MAINKDSNAYTFGFAILLVVVVGSILTIVALGLKPFQDANLKMKKQQDILASIGKKDITMKEAKDIFTDYITSSILIDTDGKIVKDDDGNPMEYSGEDVATDKDKAFAFDVKKQYKDWKGGVIEKKDMVYPLYSGEVDGNKVYIMPLVGTGLWGPIWGYVSVQGDMRTIFGATFDHKTETPGLGAEISSYDKFQEQFEKGKFIANEDNQFKKITVTKGQGAKGEPFMVDGITGGTVTSKGVEEMMERTFKIYYDYFQKKQTGNVANVK